PPGNAINSIVPPTTGIDVATRRLAPKSLVLSHRREYSGVADRSRLHRFTYALRAMCPKQIGGSARRAGVGRTGAIPQLGLHSSVRVAAADEPPLAPPPRSALP